MPWLVPRLLLTPRLLVWSGAPSALPTDVLKAGADPDLISDREQSMGSRLSSLTQTFSCHFLNKQARAGPTLSGELDIKTGYIVEAEEIVKMNNLS